MKNIFLVLFAVLCSCGSAEKAVENNDTHSDTQSVDSERVLEESVLQTEFLEPDVTQEVGSD